MELSPARDQGVRLACEPCTSRTSYAVDIVFVILREVIVKDHVDTVYVNTSRGDVGRDENSGSAVLEAVHDLSALSLLHITVEPGGAETALC